MVVMCKVIVGFGKSKSASDEKYKQRSFFFTYIIICLNITVEVICDIR